MGKFAAYLALILVGAAMLYYGMAEGGRKGGSVTAGVTAIVGGIVIEISAMVAMLRYLLQ